MQNEELLQNELVEKVEDLDEESLENAALEEAKKMKDKKSKYESNKEDDMDDEEDEEEEMKEENFKEDLDALVGSEKTLSESFREKASTIFEAALSAKVKAKEVELQEEFDEKLNEAVEATKETLVEQVDSYLNYVVESWAEENRVALESGIRGEIAESFMSNLKSVFESHYIEVPEGKEDVVESLAADYESLKEDYNSQVKKNIELTESTKELMRDSIISEASKDLSEMQADKLNSLLEDIDFENIESFAGKVKSIKESYFSTDKTIAEDVDQSTELSEDDTKEVSPQMASYLAALKKINK